MALRTIPVSLQHARITNPAGLMKQALRQHTGLRVIGICDVPMELFHKTAEATGEAPGDIVFD